MNYKFITYLLFCYCLTLGNLAMARIQAPVFQIEAIEDGDTIVININNKSQRVQLIGIDAPEDTVNPKLNLDSSRKNIDKKDLLKMGKLATEHLKTLLKPKQEVSLQGKLKQKDKYNRLPAIIFKNNNIMTGKESKSLNQQMVEDGYALLLTRFPLNEAFKNRLAKAQKKAQENKAGLWGSHAELMSKWSQ